MGKLELRLDAVARVKDTRQLIELQARLHDALNFYFGIKSKYQSIFIYFVYIYIYLF